MGSERALYVLAFILIFSTIFTADGPACGTPGCAQQITEQSATFSSGGTGISITSGEGEFATVSTPDGGSMKIEKSALQKLQNGERVRLIVRKKKAPVEIIPPVDNAPPIMPEANLTNTTLQPEVDLTNATALEANSTIPSSEANISANESSDFTANETQNISLPSVSPANETINSTLPLDNSTNETQEQFSNESFAQAAPENLTANETQAISQPGQESNLTIPENQTIQPADRGIVGEIILFYQKIMLMMAPPPAEVGGRLAGAPASGPLVLEGESGGQSADPTQQMPVETPDTSLSSQVDIITEYPDGNTVVETGIGGLAAIAESGAEEVYLDYEVSAALSDTVPLIGASAAQNELGFTGEGITICLLDTGVDFTEPFLQGAATSGYDFVNDDADASDDNGHGTRMAAIVHAVAPGASIISVKVLDADGMGYSSSVIAGIDYCMEQAQQGSGNIRIISMSLGGGSYDGYCDSDLVAEEANLAVAGGIVVTAASGNNGGTGIRAPACGSNVTAVASTTKQDAISLFSSMNGAVDLLAPGENVAVLGSSYSGSSISAAHASGAVALLLQSEPELSPSEAEWRFKTTGMPIEFNGANMLSGDPFNNSPAALANYSRINVFNAILNITTGVPTNQTVNASNETGNYAYESQTDISTCQVLSSVGGTYVLTASPPQVNGTNCFNISAANVTIDCAGYSITGNNSSSTYGIYTDQFNTTVRNCQISNFATGIYTVSASYALIDNVTVINTFNDGGAASNSRGIRLRSQNGIIQNSYISSAFAGIHVATGSNGAQVINTTVLAGTLHGIYLDTNADNVSVDCQGKSITGTNTSGAYGIYSTLFNTTIRNCNISNFQHGIYFSGATNGTIINTNSSSSYSTGYGIWIFNSGNYNTIQNSYARSEVYDGLVIQSGNFNTILNSAASSSGRYGTYISSGSNNSFTNFISNATSNNALYISGANNTFINSTGNSNTADGISLFSGVGNTLINSTGNNRVSGAGYGIRVNSNSHNTRFIGTIGYSNSSSAFYIDGGSNVSVDCQGKSIIGTNITGTYGVYSAQLNTTISNCNISNFAEGIHMHTGSHYGSINNNTIQTTFTTGYGVYVNANVSINNLTCTGKQTVGVSIDLSGTGTTIRDSYINNTNPDAYGVASRATTTIDNTTIFGDRQGIQHNVGATIAPLSITNSKVYANWSYGISFGTGGAGTPSNSNVVNTTVFSLGATAIYINSGTNVSVDCQGQNIVGTNTSATYGVYSNQINTTVKNCNISNFGSGIYFYNAVNPIIDNVTTTTSRSLSLPTGMGIAWTSVVGGLINNSNASATSSNGRGIYFNTCANDTILNTYVTAVGDAAIYTSSDTTNITITNTVASSGSRGILIGSGNGNTLTNVTGLSTGQTGIGISAATNTRIINSTGRMTTGGGMYGIQITSASHGTQIINTVAYSNGNHAFFIDGGSNVSIDCQGQNIVGLNASYGIYSNQVNTTITNCNISNFTNTIYFNGATYGTITNNTLATSKDSSYVIYFTNAANNHIVANNTLSATGSGRGMTTVSSKDNTITNLSINVGAIALYLEGSNNTTVTKVNATSAGYGTFYMAGVANNNLIANNTFTATLATTDAIEFASGSPNGNWFINNTLSSSAAHGVYIAAGGNNTFCLNNFTAMTKAYVNDTNGSNFYNCTYAGLNQGNIYANVMNGSIAVTGSISSSIPNLYIGNAGSGVPYSNTSSGGKMVGGTDYAPLTSNYSYPCGTLTTSTTMNASASINGATCFTIGAANVTLDCAGYSIIGNNSTTTYGIYSTQFNTTVRNCNISNFATGIFFNAATNGTIANTSVSTTYAPSSNDGYGIYLYNGANYNSISNTVATTTRGTAIYLNSFSNFNIFSNFTAIATSSNGNALYLYQSSNNSLYNFNASAANGYIILIAQGSSNNSISNLNATGFRGIYLTTTSNFNTLSNLSVASTSEQAISLSGSSNNTLSNLNATATGSGSHAITITSSSNNNTLTNLNATTADGTAINIVSTSNFNTLTNLNATSTDSGGYAISISGSSNNTLSNLNATNRGSSGYAIYLTSNANNNTLSNLTATSKSGRGIYLSESSNNALSNLTATSNTSYGIYLASSSGNTIRNTTIISLNFTSILLYIDAASNINTFCLNNFTNTSGLYVNDLNGSNFYNCTYGGIAQTQGNIWYNVMNGSVAVTGLASSSLSPLYIGIAGAGVPYSNSSSSGKFSCNFAACKDNAPLTPTAYTACGVYSTANSTNTLAGNSTINGATCINVTAQNVTIDCNGYNIIGNNTTGTYGIYTNQFNTTIRNCNISLFYTGIGYVGADNGSITNTNVSSYYRGIYLDTDSDYNIINSSRGISTKGTAAENNGISTGASVGNIINNSFGQGYRGIQFAYSNYSSASNSIGNGTQVGVYFFAGNYNNVTNTIGYGVVAAFGDDGSSENTFTNVTSIGSSSLASCYSGARNASFINSTCNNTHATGYGVYLAANRASVTNVEVKSLGTGVQIEGANATIDCQGRNIIGNNASATYGVYSSKFNITVKNCNISNFATGIYFASGATYGTIDNTNTSTTQAASSNDGYGIYFNNADYMTTTNSKATTIGGYSIYLTTGSNNNIFTNNIVETGTGRAFFSISDDNAAITNLTATATTGVAFYLSSATNHTVSNSTLSSGGINGIRMLGGSGNTFNKCQITGKSNTQGALYIYTASSNNTVANSTINGLGATLAATIQSGASNGNTLINNTFLNATNLLWIDTEASGNTICLNNFTSVTGYYINDTNGSNYYNCTYDGKNQGNAYANVLNGSVEVSGSIMSSLPPLYIGIAGAGVPYNGSSSLGKFSCDFAGCTDYAPLTSMPNTLPSITAISVVPASATVESNISCNLTAIDPEQGTMSATINWQKNGANQTSLASAYAGLANNTATLVSNVSAGNLTKGQNWSCSATVFDGQNYSSWNYSANITIQNSAPAGATVGSFADAAAGHWFTVNGSVTDADGGTDISATNISISSSGSCTQLSNSTSGTIFSVMYNCTGAAPATPIITIGFTDTSGAYASNSSTHAYPDHMPSLTGVPINPSPAYKSSTLVCGNGTFTDPDSDPENASARTWKWHKNGAVVAGQTAYTLAPENFVKGDNITCEQASTAGTWLASTNATNSSVLTIQNAAPTGALVGNFSDAAAGHSFTVNGSVTDADGSTDISATNISISASGSCAYLSNSTSGTAFYVMYNCTGTSTATPTVTIGFTDVLGAYAGNSSTHAYPDHEASLTQPSLPSLLHPSATVNCTPGNFSDLDNDSENSSARAWSWYRNGTVIAGQANQMLPLASIGVRVGENISCAQNTVASNWTASTAANISQNTTIAFGCGAILSSANTLYALATSSLGNGNTCFTVTASNVTLDCQGFGINGTNSSGTYGVYSSAANTTIKNCNISDFQDGVRFSGATDGAIQNNSIGTTFSAGRAIYFTSGASRNRALNNTISSGGSANGIYIDGGANITLECNGASISGGNGSGTYGIYSSQFNTTITDCSISGFQRAVAFDSATNGTVRNTNASSTHSSGYGIALYSGAAYNRIISSNGSAPSGAGIYFSSSSNNTIENSSGSSASGTGIYALSSANNTFAASNGTSGSGSGILLNASSNNSLIGAVASTTSGKALYLAQSSIGNSITGITASSASGHGIYVENSANTTIGCNGSAIFGANAAGTYGIYSSSNSTVARDCAISNFSSAIRLSGANNGLFVNNTFVSNASDTAHISISSGANSTFYWNNFTNTSGLYVDDNGSNHYNATVNGKNQGNIWANVILGDVIIQGTTAYEFGGLYIGTSGVGWPYNRTNSQGKVAGNAVDYAPAIVLSTITYVVDAMRGGLPNVYFANGSIANITLSAVSLSPTPALSVRLADGTLLLENATMSGSGPYYYEFSTNTTGWHSAIIGSGSSAYTVPYLFYSGAPWQGNFTDSGGTIFPYRIPINVSEGGAVGRRRQPVQMHVAFPDSGAGEDSFRLALRQDGQLVGIPLQVYGKNYTAGGKINAADMAFMDAYSLGQGREYYLYYAYSAMAQESIGTDLSNSGTAFSNRNFNVTASAAYGGTVTGVTSGQNGFDLASDLPAPMDAPSMDIMSFPTSRAQNASAYHSTLTNGTVFTTYAGTGEVYAYNISAMLMMNYTLAYTFYAGADYFILEANASSPFFAMPVYPFVYSDAGIYLSKDRFATYAYSNGTASSGMLAGVNISGISGAKWLSFEHYAQKSGFGIAFINNSSNAAFLPLANIADNAGGYRMGNQMFSGSANSSNYFYSKKAYVVYDPTNSSAMENTWLAILNPPITTTGARESLTTSPPAPSLEGYAPSGANDTDNLTCFAKWSSAITLDSAVIVFNSSNYSETFTVALSGASSWSNITVDQSLLQAGAGRCTITAYDIFGQSNTTTVAFVLGDRKPPATQSSNYSPSTHGEVDPNVTISVNATLAEFTDIDTAILQYNSTANGALSNATMARLENSTHIYIYGANFTPNVEGNYTYRIWANDTLGNSNASNWTNISVYYDWTWNSTPSSFSVAALFGTNASIASVILNNTGDMALSFRLSSNYYDNARIFYNGIEEGLLGYALDVPAGEAASVEVTATAKLQPSVDALSISISALNASADPQSRAINGTMVSYSGGPFPYPEFATMPSVITAGNSSVPMNASLKNLGNETATGANFTWALPSDWSVVSGQNHTEAGNMAPGDVRNFQLVVSVPTTAQTGARTVSITGTCDENKSNSASATVTVISSQPGPTPTPTPGGGGSGGGGASNGTRPNVTTIQKKVVKTLTLEQKEDYFTTLAGYDLVRGKDTSFDFNITNPFNAPLQNITINVSGYLYQYISIEPVFIASMSPHEQRAVKVDLSAPSYFTEGTFTLYFDIRGTSVEETEDSLITTTLLEKRTVELRVLDMDRDSAFRLLNQAYTIRKDMESQGIFQGEATEQFNKANASYSADKFSQLKDAVNRLYDIYTAGKAANGQLNGLKAKLDDAKSNNIKTAQTNRLYTLANLAFERGDYANAQKLANDAELTFQLESVQGFSLEAFIAKYGPIITATLFAIMLVSGCVFMGMRYWVMGQELTQLSNEEAIVIGLIKETQKDYFTGGKMSTEEYSLSLQQYDERLGKIIQRAVGLETEMKNFLNFSMRKKDKLRMEKARLEQLMQGLQRDYLEKGKVESGAYENRMKSYVARLSEIEEHIAVEETHDNMKSFGHLLDFLKRNPKDGRLAGKENANGKVQMAGGKGQASGEKSLDAKGQPSGEEKPGATVQFADKEKPAGKKH